MNFWQICKAARFMSHQRGTTWV